MSIVMLHNNIQISHTYSIPYAFAIIILLKTKSYGMGVGIGSGVEFSNKVLAYHVT